MMTPTIAFIICILGAVALGSANQIKSNVCDSCECGYKQQPQLRIVSGEVAEDACTWMVAFSYNGDIFCGGTIINSKYVLTAAHCTTSYRPHEEIEIQILRFNKSDKGETYITRKITEVIAHEHYVKKTYENDIALCKLSEEIDFSHKVTVNREGIAKDFTIRPICMPARTSYFEGDDAIALGWGRIDNNASLIRSDVLKQITLPIVSLENCRERYSSLVNITENMICAGSKKDEGGHCDGDSGGPLMVTGDAHGRYIQAGVISFGFSCGRYDWYGVSTRVSQYRDWIKDKATDGCYCKDPNGM